MAGGQPKKFKSGKALIDLFEQFCDEIAENGYCRVPNQTTFCRWLSLHYDGCDRKTIYNALNKYFPAIKSDFERIQSDLIAEGAMLGKYQSTMSIFALKNWCRWKDTQTEAKDDAVLKRLDEVLGGIKSEF